MRKPHWNCIIRFPFSAQVAPAPYAKATPIEVTKAMQQNQSILVSLAVSMNSSSQSFYMENNKLGWPIPSLKQLFTTAVAYKKKYKKGIISSWEDYNEHNVSIFCCFFLSWSLICTNSYNPITYCEFVWPIYALYLPLRIVCGFITGSFYSLSFQIWPLSQRMTWKGNGLMGLFTFHSSTEIGKILSVTWKTMGCVRSTTIFMVNFPSLDWFGWVNVWCLHILGGEIGVWFSSWGI